MENHSKYRVVAKAVKHHGDAGEQVYRASYRILDHIGEEIEASTGTNDFQDITSAFNEAFALGHERLRVVGADSIGDDELASSPSAAAGSRA